MAAWIRDGEAPNEIKVSFVVNKENFPELVEWLWRLPFRQQSAVVRNVLSEAAKIVSSNAEPERPPKAAKPAQPTSGITLPSAPGFKVEPAVSVVPSADTPADAAQGHHTASTMTDATAEILRKMSADF